jgi:hypothetical protein
MSQNICSYFIDRVLLFGKGEAIMSESKIVLERFRSLINWTNSLAELDDAVLFTPIAEGKASAAEILSHLMHWDRYLITHAIPSVLRGEGVTFPEFDPFNHLAYEYVRTGVSKNQLLDEVCSSRAELCGLLLEIGEDTLRKPITANEDEITLLHIIEEFIEHDQHHQIQIDNAIAAKRDKYDMEAVNRLKITSGS